MDEEMKGAKDVVAAMVSASTSGDVSVFGSLAVAAVDVETKSEVVPNVANLTFDSVFGDDKAEESMNGADAAMAMGIGAAPGDVMDTMSMAQAWTTGSMDTGTCMTVVDTMATQNAAVAAVAAATNAMVTEQPTACSNHANLAPLNLSGISNNPAVGTAVGDLAASVAVSAAAADHGPGPVGAGAPGTCQESPDTITAGGPRPSFKQWTFQEQFKQLYEISEDPERRDFLNELFDFMQKRGSPVSRIPIMAKVTLDLYRLFTEVCSRGGLIEVINKKMWRDIANTLGIPTSITSAAFTLRTQYSKYLYPYECETKHFSSPDELEILDATRRSQSASTPQTPNTPGVRVYSLDPAALAMATAIPYAMEPTPKRSLIGSSAMATSVAMPTAASCTSYMNMRVQQVMATSAADNGGNMTAEDGGAGEVPSMFVSMEINGMVYQGTLYGRTPMVTTATPPVASAVPPSMVGMVPPVVSLPQIPTTDCSNGTVAHSNGAGNGLSSAGNDVVGQATVTATDYDPLVAEQVPGLDAATAVAVAAAASAAAEVAMNGSSMTGQQPPVV